MKRLFLLLTTLTFAASLSAQPLRVEHNIQFGLGTFLYGANYRNLDFRTGLLAGRLSYGPDIYLSKQWSVMPEVGGKYFIQGLFALGSSGADIDTFSYLDFTVSGRLHFDDGIILGLGPMLSYTWTQDTYYIDADPTDPLHRKPKNKRVGLSLRPTLTFASTGRWRFGVEAEIGLLNAMVQYPEYHCTGNKHLHAIRVFAALCF